MEIFKAMLNLKLPELRKIHAMSIICLVSILQFLYMLFMSMSSMNSLNISRIRTQIIIIKLPDLRNTITARRF